jgi:hypothetical protein
MTLRLPLVMNGGQIEQLQAGDTIANPVANNYVADAALAPGNPVYGSAAGHVNLAEANALSTSKVLGLSTGTTTSGSSGPIQTDGIVSLTTAQWNTVTGGTGGLTYNSIYYLSPSTAGGLTTTAPTTAGQIVAPVGLAISTTDLVLYNNGFNVLL